MTLFRTGDKVRHRLRGYSGEVVAVVTQPLLRALDAKVVVRAGQGPHAPLHRCWSSDLDVLPTPAPSGAFTMTDDGALDFTRLAPPGRAEGTAADAEMPPARPAERPFAAGFPGNVVAPPAGRKVGRLTVYSFDGCVL